MVHRRQLRGAEFVNAALWENVIKVQALELDSKQIAYS